MYPCKNSEYDQEIPQSQTADNPVALVKIHQLVQKIMHGNEKANSNADAHADRVHTKNNISPPSGLGDITIKHADIFSQSTKS